MHGSKTIDRTGQGQRWPEIDQKPYYEADSVRLYRGESLELMIGMKTAGESLFSAVITDPPYCSGADTKSGRDADPAAKYCHNGNTVGRPTFAGDSRDARSFVFWCTMWLGLARRHCHESAYSLVFIDWRQLPLMTDVFQAAGWTWKGLTPWDKGRGARAPHKGYFRHQCEYVVWGTNGKVPKLTDRGPFEGMFSIPIKQNDKHHMTGKPTKLLKELVRVAPDAGLIFDPFAGSGTTGVAASLQGRRAVLFEQSEEYCEIAANRLEAASRGEIISRAK